MPDEICTVPIQPLHRLEGTTGCPNFTNLLGIPHIANKTCVESLHYIEGMTGCQNFTHLLVTSHIYILTAREKMKKCLNFCNLPGRALQALFFCKNLL
jgi:hypothetical protein